MGRRALRRLILRDCFGIIKAGLVDPANAFAPEASEGKNSCMRRSEHRIQDFTTEVVCGNKQISFVNTHSTCEIEQEESRWESTRP